MRTHATYIATIAVLLVVLFFVYDRWQKANKESKLKDSVIAEKNAAITYWVNENGKTVAQKEAAELRAKDLETLYPKVYESITKEFDVKVKNLKAYIENQFAAQGSGTGTVTNNHYYDSASRKTVRFRDFSMDDGYLKFDTRLYDSLASSLYSYNYTDTAKTVIHTKKKHLFAKEQLFASTIFSNPNAKITGTTNILVDSYKDKRWVLSAGAYFDPIRLDYGLSINFGYALLKF